MELRHVRYFVAVAEELNFSRAANKLHIAQPALSQQIQSLEGELGANLFLRTSRRVELTNAGKLFLPKARELLVKAKEAEEAVRRANRGELGTLTVGFVTSAGNACFDKILRRFRSRWPGVDLKLSDMPSGKQTAALREGRIDVGFLRPPIDTSICDSIAVSTDHMVFAIPAKHELAKLNPVPWERLRGETLLTLPPALNPGFHDALVAECRRAGFAPKLDQEADEVHTLLRLVAAGIGIAPVMSAVANSKMKGIVFRRPAPQGPELPTVAAWRKRDPSPITRAFIALVSEALNANSK